jgi:hypothetical protein
MSHSDAGGSPRNWFSILTRKHTRSGRRQTRRKRSLRTETLEQRQLLAGDIDAWRHNALEPEDVNNDGIVSSLDALMVLNAMNQETPVDDGMFTDVNNDGRRSSVDALFVINRLNRSRNRNPPPADTQSPADEIPATPDEIRTIDGTGNNLDNPDLGTADEALLRIAPADYGDGVSTPAGADRPSAREISNALADVEGDGITSDRGLSAFLYVWGQFLDHDIDLTESQEDGESFAIEVPEDDPLFDPSGSGEATIPLTRSQFDPTTGTSTDNPRQQISSITAFVDGSQVYGSDQATADSLRTFEGGQMAITDDGLLPLDERGMVIAGDIRASENISLTALQTLFVREHNRLAAEISAANPDASDEEIYQQARAVVIAEIQAITYNEFLPALLGNRAISRYEGYDPTVDPTIANEFSTAAFRFGHSTLNDDIEFFDNEGRAVQDAIELKDAFFNASLLEETGIDSILKYDASSQSQEIDLQVVDSLRNFLFGPPGAGGLDLVALNIQRGRDHGLADYNATRAAYGLDEVTSFADITSDAELQSELEALYGDVNNIDLWVGLLAEDHLRGSSVGELTSTIIVDQFQRLRDGDRFWYENIYSGGELRQLQRTSLTDVIERNTTVEGLQDNVFFMLAEVRGQVTAEPIATTATTETTSRAGRRNRGDRPNTTPGVAAMTVELLNDEGEVIATTETDRRGNYRFDSFAETGDYQIRLAETGETLDVLISNGSTRLSGMDFELV